MPEQRDEVLRVTRPAAYNEPACPSCGTELAEAWTACGDDDPQCDCDIAYDCPECGGKYMLPCGAHGRLHWGNRATVEESR